jgi:hypothetical protein
MKPGSRRSPAKDISGKRYGRLVALEPTDKRKGSSVVWLCKCDCGNICEASTTSLSTGGRKSCGCLKKENAARWIESMYKSSNEQREKQKSTSESERADADTDTFNIDLTHGNAEKIKSLAAEQNRSVSDLLNSIINEL